MKLGILFGGDSTEHEVSVISACNIIKNLDKEKYDIYKVYLDKLNNFYLVNESIDNITLDDIGFIPANLEEITNPFKFLKELDLVFPVIHGKSGEDGSIQGMCELLGVKYVGCNILSSAVCMNKDATKEFVKDIIDVVPSIHINKNYPLDYDEINNLILQELSYPVFIKPCSMGSSVGVNKVLDENTLKYALEEALKYDDEILIEKYIDARELECAIFDGKPTGVGEVISAEEYYSFDAKYQNKASRLKIPDDIDLEIIELIKAKSEEVFKKLRGRGLARIDFFLDKKTNKLYLNEINTMPGFTEISMYPKLAMEYFNISYTELLDKLIKISMKY